MTRPASAVASLALATIAINAASARAAQPPEASYVLIVAANRSLDPGVRPLRFADDDGARYYELFARARPQRIALLAVLDADTARLHPEAARAARVPWLRALREEVRAVARAVELDQRGGRRTRFTLVYVGHGNVAKDGEGYVSLQDVRLRRSDLFREVVAPVPATTIHLVIDACKSYFLVARGPDGWRDDRGPRSYGSEVRAFLGRASLEANPHVGVIVSTSGDEDVHEWSALRSGVFSHELRSALAGAADLNRDGRVEYSEVGAFIAAANQRLTHERARIRPFVSPPASDRHAPLYEPGLASGAQLELERGAGGRVSVEDSRGVRVADLNKAPGSSLRVALAAERAHYIRHGGREATLPAGSRGVVRLAELARAPARLEERSAVDDAYRDELFAFPLSRVFYEGYLATTDLPSVSFAEEAREHAAPPGRPLGVALELGYGLSQPPLEMLGGLEHAVSVGARWSPRRPFFLALRLELGASRHRGPAGDYSLLRVGALAGAGVEWSVARWAELALELAAGYQALAQLDESNTDAAGAKLGSAIGVRLRPWRSLPRLALALRAGLFGHVARVVGAGGATERRVSARPEVGLGLSWSF
jgi:hypothetical protein